MPFDANGRWTPEDDSVSKQLTGLLDENSAYIKQAKKSGERSANRRGLLNSSIAAGSAQSAAIAAAAPIASQDAQIKAQKNQAVIEGNINFDNSTRLQKQQDDAAFVRQESQQGHQLQLADIDNQAQLLRQKEAQGFQLTQQERDNLAALERLREQIASGDRQALLAAETSRGNTIISARNDLSGQYLQAISNLTANPKLKAADRNAYIAEFQRVTGQSAALQQSISNISLDWSLGNQAPGPASTRPVEQQA